MYHHVKKLMYTVRVDEPDPRFGNMLLEQFGGANGELAAAMQYSIQGLNCEDPERKDLLMDIGTRNSAISRSWAASPGCISSR
jgi:Mn-containing catalase